MMEITIDRPVPNVFTINNVEYRTEWAASQEAEALRADKNKQIREKDELIRTLQNDIRQLEDEAERNTIANYLTPNQWEALEKAEGALYRAEPQPTYGWTDVHDREDVAGMLPDLWEHIYMSVEAYTENWDDLGKIGQNYKVARVLARVLAMCAYGPEFLLR